MNWHMGKLIMLIMFSFCPTLHAREANQEVWASRTLESAARGIASKNSELNNNWLARVRALDIKQARDVQRMIIPRATLSSDRKFLRGLIAQLEAADLSKIQIQIESEASVSVREGQQKITVAAKDMLAGVYELNGQHELRLQNFASWEQVYAHVAALPLETMSAAWQGFIAIPEARASTVRAVGAVALFLLLLGNGDPGISTDFRGDAQRAHAQALEHCRQTFAAGERELRALRNLPCEQITDARLGWNGGVAQVAAAKRAIAIAQSPQDLFYCANQVRRQLFERCPSTQLQAQDNQALFRRAEGLCREIQSLSQRCPGLEPAPSGVSGGASQAPMVPVLEGR